MLARSPTAASWASDNDYSSRYTENDVVLAVTQRIAGDWYGFIEQSVVPHCAQSAKTRLSGYPTREAAQIACEDFIDKHRARSAAFAAMGDDAALSRQPFPDSYQSGFTSCAGA